MKKFLKILTEAFPVILMIGLIPVIKNDFYLTIIFCLIIGLSLYIRYHKKDLFFLGFGFVVMFVSELFFISTGVEVFVRASLFGLMPLWLPFLWAYAFVAMKRSIIILND